MKNNKKNRILFVEGAKKIIEDLGAEIISLPTDIINNTKYKVKTKSNVLNIILYNENDHEHVYTVFCRFETPTKEIGNPYSGKHNLHIVSQNPVSEILKEVETFFKEAIEI